MDRFDRARLKAALQRLQWVIEKLPGTTTNAQRRELADVARLARQNIEQVLASGNGSRRTRRYILSSGLVTRRYITVYSDRSVECGVIYEDGSEKQFPDRLQTREEAAFALHLTRKIRPGEPIEMEYL